MKRILPLIVAIIPAFASPGLQALGLAETQVLSRLNEPLRARIPLVDLHDVNPSQLHASLANEAEFQKAGLLRASQVDDLQLSVNLEGKNPTLLLSTEQAVKEPYLELLMTLEWAAEKQQYSVNILLDPPGYANLSTSLEDGSAQLVSMSAVPSTSSSTLPSGGSSNLERVVSDEGQHQQLEVRNGDALWVLANRARRGKNVTLEQAMLALLTANPDAFSQKNINALRAGTVIHVPTQEVMSAFDADQARQRVQEQNEAWQSRHEASVEVDSHDTASLGPASVNAVPIGTESQQGGGIPISKEITPPALSNDDESSHGYAGSLEMVMKQQEARFEKLEADWKTTVETFTAMRQERIQLEDEMASLREGLSGLRKEFAQTLEKQSLPINEMNSPDSIAMAADEARGFSTEFERPSMWQQVKGHLVTIGGLVAIVLLLFLLCWYRQSQARIDEKGQVGPKSRTEDDSEAESVSAEQLSWPPSASSLADQALDTKAEYSVRKAGTSTGPYETDDVLTWLENSSENSFQDDIEHEAAPPLAPSGFAELEKAHEFEDKQQWEGKRDDQDEVERVMDYEPPILESTTYQRSQEDNDTTSMADGLPARKADVHFDQKPGIGEEWEVEEVTFESLRLDESSTDQEAFKR